MSLTPIAARLATHGIRLARIAVAVVIAAWSVLLLAWLVLHWVILPHIEQWRPQLERRASAALGVAVRIGDIEVRSSGWVPALELRGVVLADADGREALKLPRVSAAVSARSLLALELRFEQLLIDGAELEVRRDALGRLHVAGIALASDASDDGAVADWFFKQHEFVVRGGKLRWVDERRTAPPLELADVTLVVRNGLRRHALRLDASPPPAWGERFSLNGSFQQPLLARAGDWRRWNGTLHVDLPRADVRELRRYVTLPFELAEGDGALRAWLDLADGEPRRATIDVALADVSLRLSPTVEPLAFARIEGRLSAERLAGGLSLAAERFGFTTADALVWPPGALSVAWQGPDAAGSQGGGELRADRIDLALTASVASRVPLGQPLRELLDGLAPRGVAHDVEARWDGPLESPHRYQAKARIQGLAIAARSAAGSGIGRPGIANADVELQLTERGGEARIAIDRGSLEFPGVFERPQIAIDELDAQLAWRVEPRGGDAPAHVEVRVGRTSFANADAKGELSGSWSTGAGAGVARGGRLPGQLELSGRLERALASSTARYLPLGLPVEARRYVERAVKGGGTATVTFRVKGDLWDFPFADARQGEFRIAARVQDVTLDYVPSVPAGGDEPAWRSPWPGFTKVGGELVFDRRSMQVRNASARMGGLELSKVNGGIRDFELHPVLAIEGHGRGPLADALRYVNATPIGGWIGGALDAATAGGTGELKLALGIPLKDPDSTTVDGTVVLAGNDVRLSPDTPLLGHARGTVRFGRNGFSIAGGAARVLGGEATFEGGSRGDEGLRFDGQGVATAEALRGASELGLLARLAGSLSGQAAYRITLGFVGGASEVSVTSTLVGIASSLPEPLGKRAETALPVLYQTTLAGDRRADGSPVRDTLRFELGDVVQAVYLRDLGGPAPRVLRGGIAVGVGGDAMPPLPASGVHAHASVATFNADAWQAAAARLFGGAGTGAAPASTTGGDAGDGYAPTQIALRAQAIVTEGRRLTRLVAGASRIDGAWRVNLDADQANGFVEWRPEGPGSTPARLHARLARLALPPAEAQSLETLMDAQPAKVPSLDIVVDDFELRGRNLGRLEIEAVSRMQPGARGSAAGERGHEWRLSKLALTAPEARFSATGQWLNAAAASARLRSALEFRLDLGDSGALLERLGFGRVIRGGKGHLQGQLSWQGSPLALDTPSLSGQIDVAIDAGQFLKADPGVGRLLGVLSLQSLPRRLTLDFRDVFQEGFAFDNVSGDIRIARGVASTNNLRMRGVTAAVLMEGSADLAAETADLRVVVVPEINAGTASLAYAVINPAVGIGTFLAQLFLRRPMMEATTREFRVSGAWGDPKVERIERRSGQPLFDDSAAIGSPLPGRTP